MTKGTIAWEGATEVLERFLDDHSGLPVRAVFTTFNFDADSFQRSWMRKLRRARAQVLVLADRRELRSAVNADASLVGFQLAPVGLRRGVFHPKLVLVRAGDDLFAAIGSGNLTAGGLGGNLELQLALSSRKGVRSPIADGIAGVLRDLAATPLLRIQASARRFITVMTDDLPVGAGVFSSLSRPLLDQVLDAAPGQGPAVTTLLSPWHANTGEQVDATVIGQVRKRLGGTVHVLTDGIAGKAPDLPNCRTRIYRGRGDHVLDDEDLEAMPTRPARLHAKSIIIQRGNRGWWIMGSANATRPALCQSVEHGGNLEVLTVLPLDARALSQLDKTWTALFMEASGVHRTPSTWSPAACGTILGGELLPTQQGITLRLTACAADLRQATLIVPSSTGAKTLSVTFTDGEAQVSGAQLKRLLPTQPDRRHGAASVILEELHRGKRHPFIVSIPLLIDDERGVALTDRIEEELRFLERRWPVQRPGSSQHAAEPGDGEGDDDLDDLTHSQHQGHLDRWAEQLHRITRLLSAPGQHHHRQRLSEICARDLPPHLRHLVTCALMKSNA